MSLHLTSCTRERAREFVAEHHRHHSPSIGSIFNLAATDCHGRVVGVAMVGRPVARALCDGATVEVTRVATDGTKNACSFLLGGCRRAAFALGFTRIITYTLESEGGGSLRGAGWTAEHITKPGRVWTTRGSDNNWPAESKVRWVASTRPAPLAVWPLKEASPQLSLLTSAEGATAD